MKEVVIHANMIFIYTVTNSCFLLPIFFKTVNSDLIRHGGNFGLVEHETLEGA